MSSYNNHIAFPGGPPYDPQNRQRAFLNSLDSLTQDSENTQNKSYLNSERPIERWSQGPNGRSFINHDNMQGIPQGSTHYHSRESTPTQSAPSSSHPRMSPWSPQEQNSTIPSSPSSRLEPEWPSDPQYSPMIHFSIANTTSYTGQGFSGLGVPQLPSQTNGLVNMSQIQGMPDSQPEEMIYEDDDEVYALVDMKTPFHEILKGVGGSSAQTYNSDMDAEGEEEEEEEDTNNDEDIEEEEEEPIIIPEPVSDTEYTPKRTTTRRNLHRVKAGRISKSASASKSPSSFPCKQCPNLRTPFRTRSDLQSHISTTHPHPLRLYPCVFSFARCASTFTSKNEWKRHVASKHMNLTVWVCKEGDCKTSAQTSEFTRKDYFTQHLRRIHVPEVSPKNVDDWISELQRDCAVVKREPPWRVACPVPGCEVFFQREGAWDERMEHVGKHLENGLEVDQGNDESLVRWALEERIIEENGGVGVGGGRRFELCDVDRKRKGRGLRGNGRGRMMID